VPTVGLHKLGHSGADAIEAVMIKPSQKLPCAKLQFSAKKPTFLPTEEMAALLSF